MSADAVMALMFVHLHKSWLHNKEKVGCFGLNWIWETTDIIIICIAQPDATGGTPEPVPAASCREGGWGVGSGQNPETAVASYFLQSTDH